jgi:hypothetical protein
MNASFTEALVAQVTADRLRAEGWEVIEQPAPSAIPFDLGSYRPDLLAHKGNQHQIIEIRRNGGFVIPEHIAEISAKVREHEGWKWSLISGSEIDHLGNLLSWEEIANGLDSIVPSSAPAMNAVFLLGTWGYVEAMLRRRLVGQNGAMVRLPLTTVIDTLAATGDLSPERAEKLLRYMSIRNETAHGASSPGLTDMSLVEFIALAHQLFSEWVEPAR